MSSIPLPALYVRPPQQQEDPVTQAMRLVQLKSLLNAQPYQQQILQQQAQGAQLENQQRQIQMQRQKMLGDEHAGSQQPNALPGRAQNIPIPNPKPGGGQVSDYLRLYSMPSDQEVVAAGGPVFGAQILKNMKALQKTGSDLQAAYSKHQSQLLTYMGNVAAGIQQSGYDPAVADKLLGQASALPGLGPQVDQLRQQIRGNPAALQQLVDRAMAMSPQQAELAAPDIGSDDSSSGSGASGTGQVPLNLKLTTGAVCSIP